MKVEQPKKSYQITLNISKMGINLFEHKGEPSSKAKYDI